MRRKWAYILILFIALLSQTKMVNQGIAKSAAFVYVSIKYDQSNFKFVDVEYDTHFGRNMVTFKNKHDRNISFMMVPNFFPVFVEYDPIKQH